MKFNEFDNKRLYKQAKEKGHTARWQEYDGVDFYGTYATHEIRQMIKKADIKPGSKVLVCGTGTGADSCWLADQGYDVTGIDISQDAIDIANVMAQKKNLNIRYVRDDLSDVKNEYEKYDLIVDSYCLQSIVLDRDRKAVYDFVKSHLKEDGFYIIISAGYSPTKDYSDSIREEDMGIVYTLADKGTENLDDIRIIDGKKYFPSRRHHTIASLTAELEENGFNIVYQNTEGDYEGLRLVAKL